MIFTFYYFHSIENNAELRVRKQQKEANKGKGH